MPTRSGLIYHYTDTYTDTNIMENYNSLNNSNNTDTNMVDNSNNSDTNMTDNSNNLNNSNLIDHIKALELELKNIKNILHTVTQKQNVIKYNEQIVDNSIICNQTLDIILSLPEFTGNPKTYNSWRTNAINFINLYKKGSPKYFAALSVLRSKITHSANEILINQDTVLNLEAIIYTLDFTYLDKRPIHIIEQELNNLIQGSVPIIDFYNRINEILHLIITKINILHKKETNYISIMAEHYKNIALRIFIKGLNQPLNIILLSYNLTDLPSALAKAQEIEYNIPKPQFIIQNQTQPIHLNNKNYPRTINQPNYKNLHYPRTINQPNYKNLPYNNNLPTTFPNNPQYINNMAQQAFLDQSHASHIYSDTVTSQNES